MKKLLLLGVLFALSGSPIAFPSGAAEPGDQFLEAYFLIQEGDAAERKGDFPKAAGKYTAALEILADIRANSPEWNPHIIDFRTKYCNEHVAAIQPKVAPAPVLPPPAEPPVTTEPPVAAPRLPAATPADTEQVRQLTAELQRARAQIQQLESTRDELSDRLQDALQKIAPTETTPQIEELLKQNQALAAHLAAAQTEAAALRDRAAEIPPPPAPLPTEPTESPELARLRADLATARGDLQRVKQELEDARLELSNTRQLLDRAQAETGDLRRSHDEMVAQLADANRKLSAAQAASDKDDEIIQQLRKENALLRVIVDRKVVTTAREQVADERPSIPELKGWRPRRRPQQPARAERPKEPSAAAMEESATGKLVATLTAPPQPASEEIARPVAAPETQVERPLPTAPAPMPPPTPDRPTVAEPPRAASPETRALLNDARASLALNDLDDAAEKYDAVLRLEPDNLTALSNIGVIRYQQGRIDEAELFLRKAVVKAPNDSAARSLLGVVYFRKGLMDDAFNELTRAVALDPRNAEAHNYLGVVLSEKGWATAGEQQIRKAIELNPQYADAHFNLAVIYSRQRTPRLELARYHYQKAIDMGAARDMDLEVILKPRGERPDAP